MAKTDFGAAAAADRPLVVTYRDAASLKPDPNNARTHPRRQIEQIKASIEEFGFANPILIDQAGRIIAGHGRLIAAKELGMTEFPTIALDKLDEAQVRALRIADNKIALGAGWDVDLLKAELADLSELDLDLTVTGFTTGEIDVLLEGESDPADDEVPAAPETPRTKPGDVWQLGDHRVACGDCRDVDFLRRVLGAGEVVDAAFLDPPYNVKINGHANARGRHREFAMASGEMTDAEFQTFLKETLGACANVSKPGAVHFVCMDWRHMHDVTTVGEGIYGALLNLCIWNKSNGGMGSLYRSKHELVFVYRVGDAPHFNAVELGQHGRYRTNVWDYASVNAGAGSRRDELEMHPTVKPSALVADAIRDVTRRGEIVLDTFLGSGTTLIAAERAGRRFRGTDIDPLYVDLAVKRWEDLTGQAATLAEKE
ncbi:DNA methylase N-4 [Pacificimonas flava]|uniref:Methyltransferase n=2 Tax=Pacificimonas TaxID=1960290 RepID=A0A219B0W7_9SPHN|nr:MULTISPECIES: DNA methyltransferase [Pacificimonas]MBZ6380097.1 ParB N-terminal domain-containing protein [Pacificimonas aurantium]OWV31992.1 DNA methylase N-4 [Pacificimonas flava]